jgi:glutathionylspermidine synthase
MQGFPTMYAFQAFFPDLFRKYFDIPENFSHYFNGLNTETYLELFREIVVGNCNPEEVILLEVKPHEQKTLIDFLMTKDALGIELVCITELKVENGNLFYRKDGRLIQVKRIYNRIIFDELHAQRSSLGDIVDLTQPLNVEWIPHPNWFYRISKFTLPFIRHPFIPETHFLSELKSWPDDLNQYVLKPLFSFAGQGVKIDLTRDDLDAITDSSNYILQKKVKYADIIETPDGPAKTEIRMMYLWKPGAPRPILVTNLARLSKGKMIGVRYNADKEWVGGTVAFFEQ